jgi:outer membrane protein assembly factor BamB
MVVKKNLKLSVASLLAAACGLALTTRAQNWPHWRGPSYNGSSPATGLPTQFSTTENVAWALPLPGPSAATPIIWGDYVFVSSTDTSARTLVALAIDRRTGKARWQHKIADTLQKDRQSNYASPSPATDGKRVIFFYGNGDLAAFDFEGERLWARNLQTDYGEFAFQWTFSASPTLHNGTLFMQVLQRNEPVHGHGRKDGPIESFILALDPENGQNRWKVARPCEAVAESHEAYSTPIPFEHRGRLELLITGGDCLTGHALDTGKELWRWGTWNPNKIGHWRLVPSPIAGEGLILACAPKGDPVYAIKAGGSGTLDASAMGWKSDQHREVSSDVPTPLFYLGDFFVLSDVRRALSRVEPRTGQVKWSIETPGRSKYEASPTGADGKVYLMNFLGEVAIVDAENGKVLQVIPLGEEGDNFTRSTIAVAHRQLFIRTNHKLYCIGES